jgi:hypothetical protein
LTADEVRESIDSSWRELTALVADFDEAALSARGRDGWSLKDQLVHIAAWEHWLLAHLEHRDRLAAMGAAGAGKSVDEINVVIYDLHRNDSPDEAIAYFRDAHRQLMAVLEEQTTGDLERPYSTFFDPGEQAEAAQQPVLVAVAANTYDHYAEHIAWIRSQGAPPAP